MPTQHQKCEQFAKLHQQAGGFIIPNPWDAGSARLLQGLGFKALATTSAGFAFTLASKDGQVTLEQKLEHCTDVVNATDIPINVDFENGFADTPEQVAANVLKVAATGAAGCSIEDFSRDTRTIYAFDLAVARVKAAAEAVSSLKMPFQLTARAENLLRGVNDTDDTIKRLQAYQAAGANVLYAPGVHSLTDLRRITGALDKPFNVLAVFFRGVTVDELIAAGAKRISVGGALTYAAIQPLITASKEMLERGTFDWTNNIAKGSEVAALLK